MMRDNAPTSACNNNSDNEHLKQIQNQNQRYDDDGADDVNQAISYALLFWVRTLL